MKCSDCDREIVRSDEDPEVWVHQDGRVKHAVVVEEEMAPRTRVVPPEGEPYTPTVDPGDPAGASLLTTSMGLDEGDLREAAEEIFEELDPEWGEEPEDLFPDETANVPGAPDPVTDEAAPGPELKEEEDIVGNDNAMDSAEAAAGRRRTKPKLSEEEKAVVGDPVEDYDHDNPIEAPPAKPMFGAPKREKMITVRGGGQYLKARDRIVWLRGEPEQHPDWTIDTIPEEVIRGTYKSKNEVTGGYARIRANVYDETGRLIASGIKTEFSERFMDFAEKAETGAIARALAVAGYGTEAALDLDEGYEDDRIADAPVASRPITISSSAVTGLVQGGRSEHVTAAQLNEIERLAVRTEIGPNIVPLIENVCSVKVPDLSDNPGEVLREFLKTLTFEQAASLIGAMNKVDAEG